MKGWPQKTGRGKGGLKYMDLYRRIVERKEKIALIGLGYVGMPIAAAFAKKADVIGFDASSAKIRLYQSGKDPAKEIGDEEIKNTPVCFTDDETQLRNAKFHIVAVPTPVNDDCTPDLSMVREASAMLGRNLSKDSVVVFESTVYPGVTEDICIPILEKESGLRCGTDFKAGYSPERINPGDKVHRLQTIQKADIVLEWTPIILHIRRKPMAITARLFCPGGGLTMIWAGMLQKTV